VTLALAAALAGGPLAIPGQASAGTASGHTFYVDSQRGHDSARGTSPGSAWQTLAKVDATTFEPGDRILLRAGDEWQGQLWPKGSGDRRRSIVLDRYGRGPKPRIDAGGRFTDAVRLFDQQYWEIRDLEVTNAAPPTATPGANLGDLRGIHVSGDDSRLNTHFVIDEVYVHDVTGEVNWIGGSRSGDAPGIRFQTGWDASKHTGGIVFDTTVPDVTNPPSTPTLLSDITVEHSTIVNTSFAGIITKQYTGDARDQSGRTIAVSTGWGTRRTATDPLFAPFTNVTIRDNYVTQAGTAYGADGVYLTDVRGAVEDHNVIQQAGTSGMETYFSDDVVIQHNEVYGTQRKAGGADFNGIDADIGTTGAVIQYNYAHDNGDGVLLCQCSGSFGSVVVRYNVIAQSARYPIYLHSNRGTTASIYNNTVYNTTSDFLVFGFGSSLNASYTLRNNVLFSTRDGAALTTSPTIHYETNYYGGASLAIPADDTSPAQGDPRFLDPDVSGPFGSARTGPRLELARGYAPGRDSAFLDRGVVVPDNGGRDFDGHRLPEQAPNVGAFESH
jgi:hypothetical protein